MTRRSVRFAAVMVAVTVAVMVGGAAAGCGVRPTGILSAGSNPIVSGQASTITLYLVGDARLAKVTRPGLAGRPYLPLDQLTVEVTAEERRGNLHTEVVEGGFSPSAAFVRGLLDIDVVGLRFDDRGIRPGARWTRLAVAQLVCTAQAVPGVVRVQLTSVENRAHQVNLACTDFADLMP